MNIFKSSAEKYYKLSNEALETLASKWNIKGYGYASGLIDRQIIIDALLKKDAANESRYALIVAVVAIILSIISLFKN